MKALALCFFAFLFIGFASTRVDVFFVDSYDLGQIFINIVLTSTVVPSNPLSNSTFYTVSAADGGVDSKAILGGERDLELKVLNGTAGRVFSSSVTSADGKTGQWEIATPNGGTSQITMQYDGPDQSSNLNVRGFTAITGASNGLDLTASGAANGLHVVVETDITTEYNFFIYDINGGSSTRKIDVPGNPGNPVTEEILYSQFTGNANFNKVGAIVVVVEGLENVDTVTTLIAASGEVPSATPSSSKVPASASSSRSPRVPSPSRSPQPDPSASKTTSVSRSPPAPPSDSRTPTNSPSPSALPTCQCNCPTFRCGLVFDRPQTDDDDSDSTNSNSVIYRPVFYYAANHDFDGIDGDRQSTWVVGSGRVAEFKYGYDDVAVYLYLSDANTIATSLTLVLLSLLAIVF